MEDHNRDKVKVYKPTAILVEFYGTLVSVKWEEEVVFPFVEQNLHDFLSRHKSKPELMALTRVLRQEASTQKYVYLVEDVPLIEDEDEPDEAVINSVVELIRWQTRKRKCISATLAIQKMVWEEGFEKGLLKTHLYPDVFRALKHWTESGIKVFVDSHLKLNETGNYLSSTIGGDLRPFLTKWFGSESGPRSMSQTYVDIVKEMGMTSNEVLLITHSGQRAKTATEAQVQTLLVARKENKRIREYYLTRFSTTTTLDNVLFVTRKTPEAPTSSPS